MTTSFPIQQLLSRTFRTALPASAATTAAVAICGRAEEGNELAPLNAISHIAWGDKAARQEEPSLKYTALGVALNAAAIGSWAFIYEIVFGRAARKGNRAAALLGGISVATLAYVTDYYVVPKRLTPGFEKRLSAPSMLAVYATLAFSLPMASLLKRDSE